jgi:hypothetical protein
VCVIGSAISVCVVPHLKHDFYEKVTFSTCMKYLFIVPNKNRFLEEVNFANLLTFCKIGRVFCVSAHMTHVLYIKIISFL